MQSYWYLRADREQYCLPFRTIPFLRILGVDHMRWQNGWHSRNQQYLLISNAKQKVTHMAYGIPSNLRHWMTRSNPWFISGEALAPLFNSRQSDPQSSTRTTHFQPFTPPSSRWRCQSQSTGRYTWQLLGRHQDNRPPADSWEIGSWSSPRPCSASKAQLICN